MMNKIGVVFETSKTININRSSKEIINNYLNSKSAVLFVLF